MIQPKGNYESSVISNYVSVNSDSQWRVCCDVDLPLIEYRRFLDWSLQHLWTQPSPLFSSAYIFIFLCYTFTLNYLADSNWIFFVLSNHDRSYILDIKTFHEFNFIKKIFFLLMYSLNLLLYGIYQPTSTWFF